MHAEIYFLKFSMLYEATILFFCLSLRDLTVCIKTKYFFYFCFFRYIYIYMYVCMYVCIYSYKTECFNTKFIFLQYKNINHKINTQKNYKFFFSWSSLAHVAGQGPGWANKSHARASLPCMLRFCASEL